MGSALNPFLSLRYEFHVNVEVCSSVDGVKYVFMYVYKDSDRQMVRADQLIAAEEDELAAFRDMRSIFAREACWRLFGLHLSDRSPAVLALHVHLEHQTVGRGAQPHPADRLDGVQPGVRG